MTYLIYLGLTKKAVMQRSYLMIQWPILPLMSQSNPASDGPQFSKKVLGISVTDEIVSRLDKHSINLR